MSDVVSSIATTLYEDIVLGILPVGNKLIEEHLAEKFSTKRHIIREAFGHLEDRGFTIRIPNRGVYVRELTPTEAREVYEVRATLECHAASLTQLPVKDSIIEQLTKIQERHSKAIDESNYRSVLHLNTEFHRVQFSACGNTTLASAIGDYAMRVQVVTALKYGDTAIMKRVANHHWDIISAMSGTDVESLVDNVRHHFDMQRVDDYEVKYRMRYGSEEPPVSPLGRIRISSNHSDSNMV